MPNGEEIEKSFSDRIRSLIGVDESVAAFARSIGLNQAAVDRYVKGQREPNAWALRSISISCGVSSDWLLGITNDKRISNPKCPVGTRFVQQEFFDLAEQEAMSCSSQRPVHAEPETTSRVKKLEQELADAKQEVVIVKEKNATLEQENATLRARMEGLEFALKAIGRERTAQDAPRERTYTEQEMRTIVRNIERRLAGRKVLRK